MSSQDQVVRRSTDAHHLPNPRTGIRAAALDGGLVPPVQNVEERPERGAPHYDSMADAMLAPRPVEVIPPIIAVPNVTPEQRSILRLAVALYRSENR